MQLVSVVTLARQYLTEAHNAIAGFMFEIERYSRVSGKCKREVLRNHPELC